VPYFIDSEEEFIATERAADREPGAALVRLIREAGDFYSSVAESE
jgi:hypothetical protein